jgi:hypothetical protein
MYSSTVRVPAWKKRPRSASVIACRRALSASPFVFADTYRRCPSAAKYEPR